MEVTYDNSTKTMTCVGDDYIAKVLLDYLDFKINQKTKLDLSKEQILDADPSATDLINDTSNLEGSAKITMFFMLEKSARSYINFSSNIVEVLGNYLAIT